MYLHDIISLYAGRDKMVRPHATSDKEKILLVITPCGQWPEAAPLPDKTAAGVAVFLYELFCRLVSKKCAHDIEPC